MNGRNYNRYTILGLAQQNKPFILVGQYCTNENVGYITYRNIRPYVPIGASTNQLCDHINIMEEDTEKYINISQRHHGRLDYLVCRASKYRGRDGSIRGGVVLTEELGIPPVIDSAYVRAREILESVPKHKLIDFFEFAEGRYAFYGKNLWVNGHKIVPEKNQTKTNNEQGSNNKKSPREYDLEEFMDMFRKENPLWIPPPALPERMNGKVFIKMAIPQKYLRDILSRQPNLRKDVLNEFRIMM